jgi:hypothetical protein
VWVAVVVPQPDQRRRQSALNRGLHTHIPAFCGATHTGQAKTNNSQHQPAHNSTTTQPTPDTRKNQQCRHRGLFIFGGFFQ